MQVESAPPVSQRVPVDETLQQTLEDQIIPTTTDTVDAAPVSAQPAPQDEKYTYPSDLVPTVQIHEIETMTKEDFEKIDEYAGPEQHVSPEEPLTPQEAPEGVPEPQEYPPEEDLDEEFPESVVSKLKDYKVESMVTVDVSSESEGEQEPEKAFSGKVTEPYEPNQSVGVPETQPQIMDGEDLIAVCEPPKVEDIQPTSPWEQRPAEDAKSPTEPRPSEEFVAVCEPQKFEEYQPSSPVEDGRFGRVEPQPTEEQDRFGAVEPQPSEYDRFGVGELQPVEDDDRFGDLVEPEKLRDDLSPVEPEPRGFDDAISPAVDRFAAAAEEPQISEPMDQDRPSAEVTEPRAALSDEDEGTSIALLF